MPMVEVIHGRTTDLFKTKDGRTVHGGFFDQLFYGQSEVKQFQIIQESYEHIVILIVSNALLAPDRTVFLERAIRDIMKSEVRVEFRFMESIPPNSAGKHRFIISKV
jgi:phenylacetate-CoA ligase